MIALIVVGRAPTEDEIAEARFVVEVHDGKHLTVHKDNWPGLCEVRTGHPLVDGPLTEGDEVALGGGDDDG